MNKHQIIGILMALIPAVGLFYLGHYGMGLLFIIVFAGLTYFSMATMGLLLIIILPIMFVFYGVSVGLFFYLYKKPEEISRRVIIGSIGKGLVGVILLVGLNYYSYSSAMSIYFLSASEERNVLEKAEVHLKNRYDREFVLKSHRTSFHRNMEIVYTAPEPDAPSGIIEFSVHYSESSDRMEDDYLQKLLEFEGKQIADRLVHKIDEHAEVDFKFELSNFATAHVHRLEEIREKPKGVIKSMEIEIIFTGHKRRISSTEQLAELKQLISDLRNELRIQGVPLILNMRIGTMGAPSRMNINQEITIDVLRRVAFREGAEEDLSKAVSQKLDEIYPRSSLYVELEVAEVFDDSFLSENYALKHKIKVIQKYNYEIDIHIDNESDTASMDAKALQIIQHLVQYSNGTAKTEVRFDFDISYYDESSKSSVDKRVHLIVSDAASVRSIQDLKFIKSNNYNS